MDKLVTFRTNIGTVCPEWKSYDRPSSSTLLILLWFSFVQFVMIVLDFYFTWANFFSYIFDLKKIDIDILEVFLYFDKIRVEKGIGLLPTVEDYWVEWRICLTVLN